MPPKLRASCDVCHSAKIKCIKTDTGCQRCDSSAGKLVCQFSPVLPRVYRNHRNRVEGAQCSQPSPPTEPSLLDDFYHLDDINQAAHGQGIYSPVTTPAFTLDMQDHGIGVNSESNSFLWPYTPMSSINMPHYPSAWPGNIDAASPTTSTLALTDAVTPADSGASISLLPTGHPSQASIEQNISQRPSAISRSESTCARTPCDCFSRLLEAMQNMSTYTTDPNPKLDAVLCANRTAAKLCLTSLQCSHSFRTVTPETASSYSTIACGLLDRMLVSYQTAFQIFCENTDGEGEKDGGEREHGEDGRRTAPATTVELRLGSFALERSEQILWAREIVAREAGKIQVTLKGLDGQGSGIRSSLLSHLLPRCEGVVNRVSCS